MILTAYAFIFVLGAVLGAAIMALVVVQSERLRKRQVSRWFALWIDESNQLDATKAELAKAKDKLSRGGRTANNNYRARVRQTTELLRSQINQTERPSLKVAA